MIRFLLLWCLVSIVVAMLWAAACGPADLFDDGDLWPEDRSGA